MTHCDCASAGQRNLDRVKKSSGAVGLLAETQIDARLICFSLHCSEKWMHTLQKHNGISFCRDLKHSFDKKLDFVSQNYGITF